MTKADLQKQIDALQKQLNEMKDDEWPKVGSEYRYVGYDGRIFIKIWSNRESDRGMLNIGNIWKTKAEAERYKLRLESMAVKWMPEDGESYYLAYFDTRDGSAVTSGYWQSDSENCLDRYNLGRTFRTEKEAWSWFERFKEAWTTI